MADGLFLILCGIPASGKTSFAEQLIKMNWKMQGNAVHFIHVSYDDFIADKSVENSQSVVEVPPKEWKAKRREIVNNVETLVLRLKGDISDHEISCNRFANILQQDNKNLTRDICHVLVIDDNMYYRSMRYEYYQLARRVNFGYAQVYLHCNTDVAIRRNSGRCNPVTMETIQRMSKVLEIPDADKFTWEKYSICFDRSSYNPTKEWNDVFQLIEKALCDKPETVNILNEVEKIKAREMTEQNIMHQADLVLRKNISEKLKHINENKAERASELNKQKKLVMATLKQDVSLIFTTSGKHHLFNMMGDNVVMLDHFWEVVTLDEFTCLVCKYFDQYC